MTTRNAVIAGLFLGLFGCAEEGGNKGTGGTGGSTSTSGAGGSAGRGGAGGSTSTGGAGGTSNIGGAGGTSSIGGAGGSAGRGGAGGTSSTGGTGGSSSTGGTGGTSWAMCQDPMAGVSVSAFCNRYGSTCGFGGSAKFASAQDCMAKYDTVYTAVQKGCAAYHLCLADSMTSIHCGHAVVGSGGRSSTCP